VFYLIISLTVLALSFGLFKKAAGTMALNKLNMVSYIFYFHFFAMSFLGSILVVNHIDNHYLINKLAYDSSRFYGWLAIMYSMVAAPCGMLIAGMFFKNHDMKQLTNCYAKSKIRPLLSEKDSYIKFFLLILSAVSVFSVIYTFKSIGTIPVMSIVRGESAKFLAKLRIDSSAGFQGNIYIRNIFAIALTPILSYIAFAYYKMTKSKKDLLWFLIMLGAGIMISTYSLAKSPLLVYMIGFLLLKTLIDGEVSKKLFVFTGIALVSILILAYVFIMGADTAKIYTLFLSPNSGITGRILLSQSAGTFFSFDIFPSRHDFLGFSSFSSVLSEIFSMDKSERSARIIMSIIMPSAVEEGTAGVINSLFIGEAWANFGLAGVIFAPLWVGFVIQWSYILLLKAEKTPLFLALTVFLTLKWPVTGGFNDFIYNAGIVTMLFIFLIILSSALMLRMINTGKKYIIKIKKVKHAGQK
jgi:hypothetical protein